MNAMFYGDYSWNKPEWRKPSAGKRERRCGSISATPSARRAGRQPFAALVNVA